MRPLDDMNVDAWELLMIISVCTRQILSSFYKDKLLWMKLWLTISVLRPSSELRVEECHLTNISQIRKTATVGKVTASVYLDNEVVLNNWLPGTGKPVTGVYHVDVKEKRQSKLRQDMLLRHDRHPFESAIQTAALPAVFYTPDSIWLPVFHLWKLHFVGRLSTMIKCHLCQKNWVK